MLLSLTTQTNFHTSIFETSLFSCNISPKKTQRSAFATQFYFCSQSWQVKLADQTKLKDTKQRRVGILLGLCKGENENSLIFIEVFGGVCFHRWSTVPLCLWKQATCSKLHKDSWPGEGWGVQAEMGTTKLGGKGGNPSIHGAGAATCTWRGTLWSTYLFTLSNVFQPTNKSWKTVRVTWDFLLSVFWFEYLIIINASALKGFKMQLENNVKTVNRDLDQKEANKHKK